ncbi:MAG: hypothetical protein JO209_09515 [Acidisphaera sp.]|nr:hypothetical protein [Acidisphaera sp.]
MEQRGFRSRPAGRAIVGLALRSPVRALALLPLLLVGAASWAVATLFAWTWMLGVRPRRAKVAPRPQPGRENR